VSCEDAQQWIHPYVDGELDLVLTLQVERHLDECPACAQMRDQIEAVRAAVSSAALRRRAPAELAARIRGLLHESGPELVAGSGVVARTASDDARSMSWRWLGIAVAVVAMASLAGTWLLYGSRGMSGVLVAQQLVTNHIRSLLADHLMDVVSTDQHTVKPWFTGKLDFSPPVEDLADRGFALSGGRLDVVGDQTVAALVYRHRKHVINLFICPKTDELAAPPTSLTRNGYHLRCWTGQEVHFAAISDLNEAELQEFADLLAQRFAPKR
jgi:anti-sigma factor (TIGR02949 family)